MSKAKKLDFILNECLDRLAKGESIEQCLASYPTRAAELEPLLRTAACARKSASIVPDPEFRSRARGEFRRALAENDMKKAHHGFGWRHRWVTVGISALILAVLASSTVVVSANAMPGDPLYAVKLKTEDIQVVLARSDAAKAELYANFADKRVNEIVAMANRGKADQVEKATERLDKQLAMAASLTRAEKKEADESQGVEPMLSAAEDTATPSTAAVPAPAAAPSPRVAPAPPKTATPATTRATPKPTATRTAPKTPTTKPPPSPTTPKAATPKATTPKATTPKSTTAKVAAATAVKATTAKPKVTNEKLAKIKAVVKANAAANQAALREALKTAPEEAKPALRQALAVSDAKYKKLLEELNDD